jgi:hypothetical protein
MWASRFRSGNFVWRHVLHMGLSTGCRLPVAQAVAAAAVRCFGSTMGSFCMIGIPCGMYVAAIATAIGRGYRHRYRVSGMGIPMLHDGWCLSAIGTIGYRVSVTGFLLLLPWELGATGKRCWCGNGNE